MGLSLLQYSLLAYQISFLDLWAKDECRRALWPCNQTTQSNTLYLDGQYTLHMFNIVPLVVFFWTSVTLSLKIEAEATRWLSKAALRGFLIVAVPCCLLIKPVCSAICRFVLKEAAGWWLYQHELSHIQMCFILNPRSWRCRFSLGLKHSTK